MSKKKCEHGKILPRGLRCDRGYLVIRLETDHGEYFKGCGPHTKESEGAARAELGRIRERQYLGTFGLPEKTKRLKFDEAAKIFHQKHYVDWRDPKTYQPRGKKSISSNQSRMRVLGEYFDGYWFDAITLKDLKEYRKQKIEFDDQSAATLNRDMATLSSMYVEFERWNAEEPGQPQVRLPAKNPCKLLPDLEETPRTRVPTIDELKRIKYACGWFNIPSMWTAIETTLCTSLRLNDLRQFAVAVARDGVVKITQSKTGKPISFPESARPEYTKAMVNFTGRWKKVVGFAGCPDLWFKDLRKFGPQYLQEEKDESGKPRYSEKDLADLLGNDEKTARRWYLKDTSHEQRASMVEATKKMIEDKLRD